MILPTRREKLKRIMAVLALLIPVLASGVCGSCAAQAQIPDGILERGVLRVGTAGDYQPMSYLDPETNSYVGFDVELAEDLAAELGVTIEYVKTSWPTLMEDTLAGKFDLAVCGITMTFSLRVDTTTEPVPPLRSKCSLLGKTARRATAPVLASTMPLTASTLPFSLYGLPLLSSSETSGIPCMNFSRLPYWRARSVTSRSLKLKYTHISLSSHTEIRGSLMLGLTNAPT